MTQVSGAMHGRRISRPVSENLLILLLACTAGLVFLDRFGIAFVFPQISSELKLGNAQLGSLMGITAVTWAISSIVFSYLSDRLGGRPKVIMISCMIGFSLMTGFIGIATSYTEILILRGLSLILNSLARSFQTNLNSTN